MEKHILSLAGVDIPLESLLSVLHTDENDDYIENIASMRIEALDIVRPVALYSPLSPELRGGEVWLNGVRIGEPFVYKMLSGSKTVVPYVASCGREIDQWSKSFSDVFEQFTADSLK